MEYTMEQKLELARKARSRKRPLEYPAELNAYMDKCNIEETKLETRHGETRYYKIESKERTGLSPLILNIHGGGFCKEHTITDTIFCSVLAVETNALVLDLDFKLSPEAAFPVAYEEGYDLLKWAYENRKELNIDPEKIIICGNSCGGNITAAIAMKMTQTKEVPIRLTIHGYSPMDLFTDPADKPESEKSYMPLDVIRAYNAIYTNTVEETKNPYVSMIFATREQLTGMPEALVITAENDSLHIEGEKYAAMLVDAGVKVTCKKFVNSRHGFIVNCMDEWQEARQLIIKTINNLD